MKTKSKKYYAIKSGDKFLWKIIDNSGIPCIPIYSRKRDAEIETWSGEKVVRIEIKET